MKNKINNTELTPSGLKQIFQERLDLSSTDLNKVAKSFSKLYNDYQADIVIGLHYSKFLTPLTLG